MQKRICVFCSSSGLIASAYLDVAAELGRALVQYGYGLVFGGSDLGLMGMVAKTVHEAGGHIVGVIPETLYNYGIAYQASDELIVTKDMRERKAVMDARSDAFVVLPGGFGTLEEVAEHLALRQLQVHTKPIVLVNANGFYDPLIAFFEHIYQQRFALPEHRQVYHVADDVEGVFSYLKAFQPAKVELKTKWG